MPHQHPLLVDAIDIPLLFDFFICFLFFFCSRVLASTKLDANNASSVSTYFFTSVLAST
jgi:surface polysaccharide O-acyltransferase-like enzyme